MKVNVKWKYWRISLSLMLRNYTAYVVDAVGLYTKKVGEDHRYALNKPMLKYTRPGDAML